MIAIRPATPDDAEAIAAIYAPHVLGGIVSFETEPPDAREMRRRMTSSDGLYPWIVATDGAAGAPIGYAYATRFRDRPAYRFVVETTIYVADGAQRRGVGRKLYGALIDTLRAQGFVHAMGMIALPNPASIRLHEAVGFRQAGTCRAIGHKLGQWIDLGIWQCALNDLVVPPIEPKPFGEAGLA